MAQSNKSPTAGKATKKREIRQPGLIRWVQMVALCLRSSRHFQCCGRRARHCSSRNVPPSSPMFGTLTIQSRGCFKTLSDACNPARWAVQAHSMARPRVSWRRTASDDAPGSQIDRSAQDALGRLSRTSATETRPRPTTRTTSKTLSMLRLRWLVNERCKPLHRTVGERAYHHRALSSDCRANPSRAGRAHRGMTASHVLGATNCV
jgi:hypothetical protein